MSNTKSGSICLWTTVFVSCRLSLSFPHFSVGLIFLSLILHIREISHILYWTPQISFLALSLVLSLWDGFVSATLLKLLSIKYAFVNVSWICDILRKTSKTRRWFCVFKNKPQLSAPSGHCPTPCPPTMCSPLLCHKSCLQPYALYITCDV